MQGELVSRKTTAYGSKNLRDMKAKQGQSNVEPSTDKEADSMLELYNTMSRSREAFKPRQARTVKMFTCGPSIYRRPHIGNYRTFLWEDLLQRYLGYLGYKVERIINFTDIEDKALAEATHEGLDVAELTGRSIEQFHKDADLLGMVLPDTIPRSSTTVDQAAELIDILLTKGVAYRHEGDIFFDPLKYEGFGKLFRLDMNRWPKEKRRFKRDTYPGRRWNLGDFILWHGYREGDPVFWDTKIGKGRPAWNIQDPAIISGHLGPSIDIACGGIDNIYRHHDYNLAVMESAFDVEFSRFWLHGEHVLSGGKKMSKSLGNILYPEDLVAQGYSGSEIRFYLLYVHHRKKINISTEKIAVQKKQLEGMKQSIESVAKAALPRGLTAASDDRAAEIVKSLRGRFESGMNDDLNVKAAFDALSEDAAELATLGGEGRLTAGDRDLALKELRQIDRVLRILFD